MSKQFKAKDIQEAVNVKREDESKTRIKECAEEVEKVLAKFGMTITPTIQITDVRFEREMLKQATEQPAEKIKK